MQYPLKLYQAVPDCQVFTAVHLVTLCDPSLPRTLFKIRFAHDFSDPQPIVTSPGRNKSYGPHDHTPVGHCWYFCTVDNSTSMSFSRENSLSLSGSRNQILEDGESRMIKLETDAHFATGPKISKFQGLRLVRRT